MAIQRPIVPGAAPASCSDPARADAECPGHRGQVPEHVQGHEHHPRDEAHLVQHQPRIAVVRPGEQKHDAAGEHDNRREHDERADQTQDELRRSLAPVLDVARVVAQEPITGARHLEHDRPDQQEPDEQVHRDELAQLRDREADHGEQHDQDPAGDRRQLLVAVGAAAGQSDAAAPAPAARSLLSALRVWARQDDIVARAHGLNARRRSEGWCERRMRMLFSLLSIHTLVGAGSMIDHP